MNCHVNLNVGSIAKSVGSEEAEGPCPPAGAHGPLLDCCQVHRLHAETELRSGYLPC